IRAWLFVFFFSSRRRHTILVSDWSSDVCSSDLAGQIAWMRLRPRSGNGDARPAPVRTTPITLVPRRHANHWIALSPRNTAALARSEERRVGEERRSKTPPSHENEQWKLYGYRVG